MKKRKLISILFSLFSLCVVCSCTEEGSGFEDDFSDFEEPSLPAVNTITLNEYKEDNYQFDMSVNNEFGSVAYEIFVRSFYDTDGDGIGDLNGVKAKLPYLKDLGVKTLWLMPIMPSPTYHGYDVTDYYAINPDYGTMDDFLGLIEEAEKNNIDIMIDIVFNHSSTKHPWFIKSYEDYVNNNTSPDSLADWYNWQNSYGTGYSIYSGSNGVYYESRFDYSMPDFNTSNEAVRQEMVNILKYWALKGVKGFRFDAVKYYQMNDTLYNVEFLSYLHDEVKKEFPDVYFVGECWDNIEVINSYYKSSFESFFNFPSSLDGRGDATILSQVKNLTSSNVFGNLIENRERLIKENNPNAYSSYFLSNHDMDRASKNLTNEHAKMAASLTYLMPGMPFMYYGEEIGLKGVRNTSPEDSSDVRRRLPMIWSSTDKIGECDFPEKTRPDLMNNSQVSLGVEDLINTNYSLLNHYKKVIEIRNKYPFIKDSIFINKTEQLNTTYKNVLAYELSYNGSSIIIIHNFHSVNVEVDVKAFGNRVIADEISVSRLIPELSGDKLKLGKLSTVILV